MMMGLLQEEDITVVSIHIPNTGAPIYLKQILTTIKGEINSNTVIVGDFNTSLIPMDRLLYGLGTKTDQQNRKVQRQNHAPMVN